MKYTSKKTKYKYQVFELVLGFGFELVLGFVSQASEIDAALACNYQRHYRRH